MTTPMLHMWPISTLTAPLNLFNKETVSMLERRESYNKQCRVIRNGKHQRVLQIEKHSRFYSCSIKFNNTEKFR